MMLCHLPSTHCRSFKKREKTALAALKKGAVFPANSIEEKKRAKKKIKLGVHSPQKNVHTSAVCTAYVAFGTNHTCMG